MEHRATLQRRRAALASTAGTALEFFDFVIFGIASATVFGTVFFAAADPVIGLLASFATLGVGFVARPLGAVLFGHLGDKVGRKRVFSLTLIIMGSSTVLIGCIPSFAVIGYLAPALLVCLRLIQGLAYGGEWGGAVIMSAEHAPQNKRGLFAAFPQIGVAVGIILGNGVFLLVNLLGAETVLAWAWRIPFWIGGLLLVLGVVVRRAVDESPEFERNREEANLPRIPVIETLRYHWRAVLLAAGVQVSNSGGGYVVLTFSLAYAADLGIESWVPLTGVLAAAAVQGLTLPVFSSLSDKYGRMSVYGTGTIFFAIAIALFLPVLDVASTFWIIVAYLITYGIGHTTQQSTFPVMFVEAFDSRVGYTGVALGSQIGTALGGLVPFVSVLLISWTGTGLTVGLMMAAVLLGIGLPAGFALARIRKTRAIADAKTPAAV